ncbi:MAG: ANTAR domain-containing protein [Actinomycetota bacterium]|nr:ANTAR domain-containing protein [Actinomycetota bacterium]
MSDNGLGAPTDATSVDMAQHLADIARVLLSPGTVAQILTRVATYSVAVIDGCDEAGLCHGAVGAVATSDLILELDALQDSLGEGPCVDALRGEYSIYVADLTAETPWPAFGPAAAAAGLRSALAYRLFVGDETLGALQLYARLPAAFNAIGRAQGLLFAAHAGMALDVARSQALERGRAENLQAAMASREIIGQAQGILMERERITADQAFELLRHASQHLNVKLRDVAQTLVDTGAVPGHSEQPPAGS